MARSCGQRLLGAQLEQQQLVQRSCGPLGCLGRVMAQGRWVQQQRQQHARGERGWKRLCEHVRVCFARVQGCAQGAQWQQQMDVQRQRA